jgi:hypothetical protein
MADLAFQIRRRILSGCLAMLDFRKRIFGLISNPSKIAIIFRNQKKKGA